MKLPPRDAFVWSRPEPSQPHSALAVRNLRTLATSIPATVCANVGPPDPRPNIRQVAPSLMESNHSLRFSVGAKHHCPSVGPATEELVTALGHLLVGASQLL
jgi:hypothetical protein